MKFIQFISIRSTLLLTLLMFVAMACNKEQATPLEESINIKAPEPGKFKTTLTLSDATGDNTATIEFSSNSEQLINELDENSYTLYPILENELVDKENQGAAPSEELQLDPEAITLQIKFVDMQLADGVAGLGLSANEQSAMARAWSNQIYVWLETTASGWYIYIGARGGCTNAMTFYHVQNGNYWYWNFNDYRAACYPWQTLVHGSGFLRSAVYIYNTPAVGYDYYVFRF